MGKFAAILLVGNDVYKRIKAIEMSAHERSRITKRMELLLQLITDLQQRDIEDLPGPAVSALDDVLERIEACEKICESTKQQNKLTKFLKAHTNLNLIVQMENELERAVNSANLAVNAASLVLTDKVQKTVVSESEKTQSMIQNPMAGLYMVDEDNTLKPPAQLPPPSARMDRDLLVVNWNDPDNCPEGLKFYELMYTDVDQLPPISPKYTSIKLGPPKIQPGCTYTIRIRGVNDCGPGEWSQSVLVCFQCDEKEQSDEEELRALAQTIPNNDLTALPVPADVTQSIGAMSISTDNQSVSAPPYVPSYPEQPQIQHPPPPTNPCQHSLDPLHSKNPSATHVQSHYPKSSQTQLPYPPGPQSLHLENSQTHQLPYSHDGAHNHSHHPEYSQAQLPYPPAAGAHSHHPEYSQAQLPYPPAAGAHSHHPEYSQAQLPYPPAAGAHSHHPEYSQAQLPYPPVAGAHSLYPEKSQMQPLLPYPGPPGVQSLHQENSQAQIYYPPQSAPLGQPLPYRVHIGSPYPPPQFSVASAIPQAFPVPSAPLNLRLSTKHSDTLIKVRWYPPYIHPEAVLCYELQMHPKKSSKSPWRVVATSNKCSAKATNLQSNTTYEFRVQALNVVGTPSPYSEVITASTKVGGISKNALSGLSKVASSGGNFLGSSKITRKSYGGGESVFGKLSRGMTNAGNYLGNKAKVEDDSISPQSSEDEQ